jgi:biotin transport system substrate-specific component
MVNIKNGIVDAEASGVRIKASTEKFIIKLTFSFAFAMLMSISANAFTYLPFTPVPITLQVITVLLSSIFLGSRWAPASQFWYILMGVSGMPVFAGFKSGTLALTGPTGGYIIGFIFASFITGYIYENYSYKHRRGTISYTAVCFASCFAGLMVIYFFGYIHLLGYLYNFSRTQNLIGLLAKTWKLGIQPFIIADLLKVLIVLNILKVIKIKGTKNK